MPNTRFDREWFERWGETPAESTRKEQERAEREEELKSLGARTRRDGVEECLSCDRPLDVCLADPCDLRDYEAFNRNHPICTECGARVDDHETTCPLSVDHGCVECGQPREPGSTLCEGCRSDADDVANNDPSDWLNQEQYDAEKQVAILKLYRELLRLSALGCTAGALEVGRKLREVEGHVDGATRMARFDAMAKAMFTGAQASARFERSAASRCDECGQDLPLHHADCGRGHLDRTEGV